MMISTDFEARKAIIDKLGGNSATLTSIFQCELVILALYGGDPHNASNIFEADKLILSQLGGDPTKVNTVFEARKAIITRLGGSTIGISNNYEASLAHFELAGGEIPDITYYSVVFKNWNGTILYTTNVIEGHTPIYNGNIPTRPSDEQYNYTFNGWTPSLGPVYGNIEYTASYTATEIPVEPVYYTVVFKNWDGTILQTSSVEEGQTAVYNGSTPARPSDSQYNYTFNGWLPSLGPVNENIEYTAQYTATAIPEPEPNIYTIKFINWNGDILQTINVEEGQTPVYTGSTPARPSDEQYNYSFNGWTPSITPATANATYTASYTATAIPIYTIKFINWNGSVLQTMQVKEGVKPVYTGSTPARPSDNQYDYTFNGWHPIIEAARRNLTYTAQYTATAIPGVDCTVVFKDYDGTILQTSTIEKGQTPVYTGSTPTRQSDGQYDYTFNGWTPDLGPVYGDVEYTAQYTAIPISVVADYLKIDGANYVRIGTLNNGEHPIPNLQYSMNKTYWYDCWLQAGRITTVHCDGPIYFRGYNPNGLCFDMYYNYIDFQIEPIDDNTRVVVSGNIMSLLDNGTGTITEIPNEYCFSNLFKGESYSPNTIYDASKLKLPNNTTSYCYQGMFNNCQNLKYAPSLPAATLAQSCYFYMFNNCPNLTEVICLAIDGYAPNQWIDSTINSNGAFIYDPNTTFDFTPGQDIPYNFTKIANNVMSVFFASAGSVRIAKTSTSYDYQPVISLSYQIPDEIVNDNFINAGVLDQSTAGAVWYFKGNNPNGLNISNTDYVQFDITGDDIRIYGNIMSLLDNGTGTITEIPNERCFAELFRNTPITRAPELPATTLTRYCYLNMFRNCTNLTNAPELPATTLAPNCYQSMFNGCTNLRIVDLPATTLASACYNQTFVGCTSLTNITLPAITLADSCYNQMLQNCSSLNYIICLASDYTAVDPTNNWVVGVASTGFFIANFSTYLEIGSVNGIPAGWDYSYF